LRVGEGNYYYKDGSIFIGKFKDNEKDGIGRMSYLGRGDYHGINFLPKRFTNFLGEFLNGKRHGDGLFTYSNKDIYSGQWKNGKKHGNGTYIFAKKGGDMKVFVLLIQIVIVKKLKGRWDEGQL